MTRWLILSAAALALGSCGEAALDNAGTNGNPRNGRYVGIGIYGVGNFWSQIAQDTPTSPQKRATLAEDETIIVVVDTRTGEVRQCGNFSGYCVAMNPWGSVIDANKKLPVVLKKNVEDLAQEAEVRSTNNPH